MFITSVRVLTIGLKRLARQVGRFRTIVVASNRDLVIANLCGCQYDGMHLCFIVVTHPEGALATEAVGPEAFERWRAMSLSVDAFGSFREVLTSMTCCRG
jgi:hypothetical protein